MINKSRFLFLVVLFFNFNYAQNKYFFEIRTAEKLIVQGNLEESVKIYKKTFDDYNYPYIRDVLAATGVAQHLNDKKQFYIWLEYLLNNGLSENDLDYFVNKYPNDSLLKSFKTNFKTFEQNYLKNINYEIAEKYVEVDKNDQLRLFLAESKFNSEPASKYQIDNQSLINKYIDLVNKYGFPSDKLCGIGSHISTVFTDEGLPSYMDKDYIVENIKVPDVRVKTNDSVYFTYSFIKSRKINKISNRRGNSLLWHQNIKNFPVLDSLILEGIQNLKVYPSMYAACLERYNVDYLIGMGGTKSIWHNRMRANISKINMLTQNEKNEINERRVKIGLRTIEEEYNLHAAIIKLEKLNKKHFKKLKRRNLNIIYYSFFNTMMP
ncbi:MAG: hypothetical protein WD512_02850 [Candidatus Paceibacterota bacterium]